MALSEGQARVRISWTQFHYDCAALATKLKDLDVPFLGIVAVSRGGLIPAGILAYELGIKYVDTYCLASYDEQQRGIVTDLKMPDPVRWNGRAIVVIDDLVDTGESFRHIQKTLHRCHYASIYAKPAGKTAVQTYLTEYAQDTWIDFPWD